MRKRKSNNGIFYIAISLVVGIAILTVGVSIAFAYVASQIQNIETYNYYESEKPVPEEVEVSLSAFPGPDIYGDVAFHDDVILNGAINISLDFSQATSSATGNWILVLGKKKYVGTKDLVCEAGGSMFVDMNGLIPWTGNIQLATSTCTVAASKTCGDGTQSFHNTTTYDIITEPFTTSTAWTDPANADDDEGDFTRETFVLTDNDWILITADMEGEEFSTTTFDLGTSGGITATGYAKIQCVTRTD